MNQSPISSRNSAFYGAAFMVAAGVIFAVINVLTQWVTAQLGFPSTALAFWQYGLALIFFVPSLMKLGRGALATEFPLQHFIRVVLATLGVQFFIGALAKGVPIWQVIAIDMTSPFLVILGARLFLGEYVGANRAAATVVGFIGGMLILAPWSDSFSLYSLLPLGAAVMWAGSSLMTRRLATVERPETVTIYLLLLLTPINAAFLVSSTGFDPVAAFAVPTGLILAGVVALAALTAAAQHLLTLAYSRAEAAFLQPFDDLRLPLNVLGGWLAFAYAPNGYLWVGAALIVGASLYLLKAESGRKALVPAVA